MAVRNAERPGRTGQPMCALRFLMSRFGCHFSESYTRECASTSIILKKVLRPLGWPNVPKSYDIPASEKAIGRRLREFRLVLGLSQAAFARRAGLDAALLASYEHGRSRLNYSVAWKVLTAFQLNPECLAIPNGRYFPPVSVPTPEELKIGERTPFSTVYAKHLAPLVSSALADWSSKGPPEPTPLRVPDTSPRGRVALDAKLSAWLRRYVETVPDACLEKFADGVYQHGTQLARSLPRDTKEVWERRLSEMEKLRAQQVETKITAKAVDMITLASNSGDVQDEVGKLRRRLKRATRPYGKKAELARLLGVAMPRISDWLSGKKEPGGETALRLLRWVEQQERTK